MRLAKVLPILNVVKEFIDNVQVEPPSRSVSAGLILADHTFKDLWEDLMPFLFDASCVQFHDNVVKLLVLMAAVSCVGKLLICSG